MIKKCKPKNISLPADSEMPNNQSLPVLFYQKALNRYVADKVGQFEKYFSDNGWGGTWQNGIYNYHHFHSNAHEVMGIAKGNAEIMLGGKTGILLNIVAGDMLVLPAGTGHKSISASEDFLVVGAYPLGQEKFDICRNAEKDPDARSRIKFVPYPPFDPLFGKKGPLTRLWY